MNTRVVCHALPQRIFATQDSNPILLRCRQILYHLRHQGWLRRTLQIAEKGREEKGKGEKERYTQLNEEFQRITRRNKIALSKQSKEIEETNRMGKTRDLQENWK